MFDVKHSCLVQQSTFDRYPACGYELFGQWRYSQLLSGNNGFFGTQFLYPTLSNKGAITSFSELTFTGFIWFNKKSDTLGGKQVIFYFMDGYQNTLSEKPYVNLGLSIQYRDKILVLQVLSGNPIKNIVIQELILLNGTNTDPMVLQWYNFVVSVNIQTDQLQFLNMKLYGMQNGKFWNYQIPYIQNNTFAFQFSEYSRITNERLITQDLDTRLCGSLAKFNIYLGFSTMDQEYYVDYEAIPLHLVRGIDSLTSLLSLTLNSAINNQIIADKGIRIFKNTQIQYTFPQNYDNLTISFWMFAATTEEFQILSLVETDKQSISLGLGIDSTGNLVSYSNSSKQNLFFVGTQEWHHIGLSFIRRIYTQTFQRNTTETIVKVVLNGRNQETSHQMNYSAVTNFQYLNLGFVTPQNRDSQYVDIYDLRIYQGFSFIQWINYDCNMYVSIGNKSPCIRCGTEGSQFCFESPIPSSMDITEFYNCPAGYIETTGCPPVTISNCARQNGTICNYCNFGYNLESNQCNLKAQTILSQQDCINGAIFCQISNQESQVVVCGNELQFKNNQCLLNNTYDPEQCSHVYKYKNEKKLRCYNCIQNTYNLKFKCVDNCADSQQPTLNKIANSNWCSQTCPKYYDYFQNCTIRATQIRCETQCTGGSVLNNINCLYPKQSTTHGKTESCLFSEISITDIDENWQRILKCHHSCKYCFHPGPKSCLSCSNSAHYYDPYQSTCLEQCDQDQILPYSDFVTKVVCPNGYYPFLKQCVLSTETPLNAYLDTSVNQFKPCPFLCYTCLNALKCTKCMTNYFLVNNKCQLTCFPLIYYDGTSDCVSVCPANSYYFPSSNLNGYQVASCFQNGCGQVWAGIPFDTFLHHSNPFQCVLSCDPGYFENKVTATCSPCTNNCKTCQGSGTYCTSCVPGVFQRGNQCFSSCPRFADYINQICVESCPTGSFIAEKANACLPVCGQYLPIYNKVYLNKCYDTPPAGIGCDATNQCYPCHAACITCNGPNNTNCLSCYPNTYLNNQFCGTDCGTLQYDMKTWLCSATCSSGTFKQGQYCSTTCLSGYYQFGSACFESTPTGAYCLYSAQKQMYLCDPCFKGCKTCTGNFPNQCNSCSSGFYYHQNECLTKCPSALPVMDSFTNLCTNTCAPQYYLYDNVCQTTCPTSTYKVSGQNVCFSNGCGDGYYAISGQSGCFACDPKCSRCKTTSNNCQGCKPNYFLTGSSCNSSCPSSTPFLSQVTWKCVGKCQTSDYTYINTSTGLQYCMASCPDYQLGRQCFDKCPIRYYPNPKICDKCNQTCSYCSGPSSNQCTQCISGFYLNDTTCVTQCPPDKPLDVAAGKCSDSCSGYLYKAQGVCLATCPSYLLNSVQKHAMRALINNNQNCTACATECINCYGTLNTQCTECASGYFMLQTSCLGTCPNGYFQDMVSYSCVSRCSLSQFIIQSLSQCVARCPSNMFSYGQNCLSQCPSFTYISDKACQDCDPKCLLCFGPSHQECTQCTSLFYLQDNTCSSNCPIYYDDSISKCVEICSDTQLLVFDTLRCVTSCPSQYLTSNTNCVYDCPIGQYEQGSDCLNCDPKCTNCIGSATFCTSCATNFVLDINQCGSNCVDTNLFIDMQNQLCQSRCPDGLLHYSPPKTTKRFCVTTCPLQYDSFCIDNCPDGLYASSGNCVACPSICLTCLAANNCQTCAEGYYLNTVNNLSQCQTTCNTRLEDVTSMNCVDECLPTQVKYNNQCLQSCPTQPPLLQYQLECVIDCPKGSYRELSLCKLCDSQCTDCFGPLSTQCVACASGFYLNGNECGTSCGSELQDEVNHLCVTTCGPLQVQNGQTCIAGCPIVQYGQDCLAECPKSTFQMGLYCVVCQVGCEDCNIQGCQKCISGYLSNNACGTFCSLYYDDVNMACASTCPEKSVTLFDHCLQSCPLPYYEYKGNCQANCPLSTFSDSNYKCNDCQERCFQCDNNNNCLICNEGYYLYQSRCVVQCPIALKFMDTINGICRSTCPNNSFIKGNFCVQSCDLLILNSQCIANCNDGYFQNGVICAQCQSQCSTCDTYSKCTSCKSNFYLDGTECNLTCPNLMNQILWECTDDCTGVVSGKYCLTQCPINSLLYKSTCIQQCPKGYFKNNTECIVCPSQCLLCTSQTSCSLCSVGYFLNNQQCVSSCPIGLYGDLKKRECVNVCPLGSYKYLTSCLFQCPKPYVQSDDLCATQCKTSQYRSGYVCNNCSVECEQCSDFGNDKCVNCASGFTMDSSNRCIGACPEGYYMKDSCRVCAYQCSTCDTNGCLTCRGDRNMDNQICKCSIGYYDDGVQDQCQQCPCPECTSPINCTKCINNLKPPNCSCDKQLNDEYCINCDVAQVTIYFTNSLNSITVDFSLLISINLDNPFVQNECQYFFVNFEMLGLNSICYLDWNRTQIHIGLGKQATIQIGDSLQFQPNMFKYVNDEDCQNFISTFINSTILEPAVYLIPYIIFDVQPLISSCMDNTINQISKNATGNRDVQVISWELQEIADQDHFWQIKDFLSKQKNNLVIPSQTLRPNFTYYIQVKYINFLGKLNQTLLVMKTIAANLPYISLNQNKFTLDVYIFDCITSFLDLSGPFQINYVIFQQNGTEIFKELVDVTSTLSYQLPLSKLPKGTRLKIDAYVQESQFSSNFTLPFQEYIINFTYPNRFVGTIFNISSRAYDIDIKETVLQSLGFTYEWLCINKQNLNPCKNSENQIITFDNSRILKANLDFQNLALLFYVRASKNNRYSIAQQVIVVSELNNEYEFIQNNGTINGYINPNDMVTVQLKDQQTTAIILQDDQIINSKLVDGNNFRFIFSEIAISNNHILVFLLPGKYSLKFALNSVPVIQNYTINPKSGHPLDKFTYNIVVNQQEDQMPYTFNIYYYLLKVILDQDVSSKSNLNGIPVVTDGISSGNFTLPGGIADQLIHILIEVRAKTGSLSQITTNISITLDTFTIKTLQTKLESFFNNSDSSLSDIYNGLQLFKSQTQQVCLKQCSGVGVCINKVCNCPAGYYFEDCSGSKSEYQAYIKQFKIIYQKVIDSDISDSNYLLYIRSLNYLRTFSFINTTETQSHSLLNVLSNNIESRMNKINKFAIGLQAQNTSEFNYNQMDIKSIVNQVDLQTTLNTTSLVWLYMLNNFSNYEIQYKLRNIIGNTIELYLQSLLPGESTNLTYDACKIVINRTNSIDYIIGTQINKRLLASSVQYFDVIQTLYLKNLYCTDGYFPYDYQCYPVYDYKIRQQNRLYNIQLKNSINYSFPVDNSKIYVCIQRSSSTFNWDDNYCSSKVIENLLYCNCTMLAPTTYVEDNLYIYEGSKLYRITVPNIVVYGQVVQLFAIIIVSLVKVQEEKKSNVQGVKFGKVIQIRKRYKLNNQISQIEETIDLNNKKGQQQISQNQKNNNQQDLIEDQINDDNKYGFKYSLSQYHLFHYFFRIIFKPKQLIPKYFRLLVVWFRWSAALMCVSYMTNGSLKYNIAIYPSLGVIILLRIFDLAFEKIYKQSSYLKNYVNLFFILLLIVLGNLVYIVIILYQCYYIQDQTDWFISYYGAFVMDFLFIDLLLLLIERYLGTDIMKKLKKKIKDAKQIQKLKKEYQSQSQSV
ncbi:hypothetical protein pb186bvf_011988 [Paramecium bursaria]